MGKIIGNFCVIVLFFYGCVVAAGIRLEVRTIDGIAQNSIAVGQPFLVEVTIDGVKGSVKDPIIDGLSNFNAKRTGMFMSSVNGASTTKYTYQLRINTTGSYKIGPARLVHNKQSFVSDVVSVEILNDVVGQSGKKNNKSSQEEKEIFLRLIADAERVVVGQKIAFCLRLYYQDSSISLLNIGQPDITMFDVKLVGKPVGGTTDIDGVHYRYAEWKWDMYPKSAGEFVIPAYNADYEAPSQESRFMGGLFSLMSMRSNRKRVYSNAVKIMVDELPYCSSEVQAIGNFESIKADITPPVAKEGEGMVLAIEITGEGNFDAIKTPTLSMPAGLKYYDSNITVIDPTHDNELPKKRFEFIVQGMREGDWEIPEQSFVYFDIKREAYVTLRTSPLSVSIQPSINKSSTCNDAVRDFVKSENSVVLEQEFALPLNEQGPLYPVSDKSSFPWVVFHGLLLLPLIYVGYPLLRNRSFALGCRSIRSAHKRACRYARKKIMQGRADEADAALYSIFINLFVVVSDQSSLVISGERIEAYLAMKGFSQKELQEWHIFFEKISHAAYAQSNGNTKDELSRMAIQWIDRLEKAV